MVLGLGLELGSGKGQGQGLGGVRHWGRHSVTEASQRQRSKNVCVCLYVCAYDGAEYRACLFH